MKMADVHPSSLVASAERGYMSLFQLTNPDLRMKDGTLIEKEHIGIEWERILDSKKLMLSDLLTFENFSEDGRLPDLLPVPRRVRGRIRGARLAAEEAGQIAASQMGEEGALNFMYDGADGLYSSVSIYFSEKPQSTDDNKVHFDIRLKPRERKQLLISMAIAETKKKADARPEEQVPHPDVKGAAKEFDKSADRWMGDQTTISTDSLLVNNVLDRSLRDLHVLRSGLDGEGYFAAGLPWFGTLFGRDSLITSLQTLAYRPSIAEQTLRLLAQVPGHARWTTTGTSSRARSFTSCALGRWRAWTRSRSRHITAASTPPSSS